MFWLLFFVFGFFSYFAWSSIFGFSQLQYSRQQQDDYERGYDYDQKYQQVMHGSQIHEQGVFALSAICTYNTFQEETDGCLCLVFQKKAVFSNIVRIC
jgi:hypothetical protein